MQIINNMPITAVAAVVVLTVSAAALAAEDDMTADAIVNGVHGYMPDNYVVPKEPEVRERLEWLKDQKLALMMHFGMYSQMGIFESWALSDADAHWSRVQIDWTDDAEAFKRQYWDLWKSFNPVRFQPEKWARLAKDGGFRYLVFTTKHHDGFCLWPTKTTEHNITKTPFWRGTGNGERGTGRDYVKEMEQACRRAGVKFGVYCSPWDRNSAHYATDKYVEIYHAQIKELLGGAYGEVFEMWFDGANGGDGYYGGAREKRRIGAGDPAPEGDAQRHTRRGVGPDARQRHERHRPRPLHVRRRGQDMGHRR